MRKSILTAAAMLACLAHGQPADKTLTFDAATVKPAVPPTPNGRGMIMMAGPSGGPGTKDPGRIHYPFMSLKNILMNAYDVKNFQISGPSWLDTERFDIEATMPPDTTKEQFRVMLQNLLAERFKLTIHRDSKELPMYTLIVGKNGPKMKESEAPPPPPADGADATPTPALTNFNFKMGADGFPTMPAPNGGRGGMNTMMMPGRARMTASKQTMQDLAARLTGMLNRPVTDATALTAKFDFTLTYSPEGLDGGRGGLALMGGMLAPPPGAAAAVSGTHDNVFIPEGEAPQDLFSALQSQLGLKLEPKKGPVELIVIDHMEKTPTEN
jgi:uncharacterized protein (TIGR03435 family)